MSESNNLIERLERQFGANFWDDPKNVGTDALAGAIGREMGMNLHGQKDDVVAGMLLRRREKKEHSSLAMLFAMGLSPDDIAAFNGKK